ncbi:MAG: hypothetical protein K2G29_09440, partial [Muribaculaceae bacterium]|nr:hypothetical protein [Muribaculaceae bacterium]
MIAADFIFVRAGQSVKPSIVFRFSGRVTEVNDGQLFPPINFSRRKQCIKSISFKAGQSPKTASSVRVDGNRILSILFI